MANLYKKGVVFNVLMWFFKIFFLVIVLFTLILLIRSFIVTELNVFNAESDIFIQRIMLSRDSISYYDVDIDRVYPGIIDLDKFTSATIDKVLNDSVYYGTENKKIAASFTLKDESDNVIKSITYNPDYFSRWKEMYEAQWMNGPGGVGAKAKRFEVLIKGTELKRGFLEIVVILPNS